MSTKKSQISPKGKKRGLIAGIATAGVLELLFQPIAIVPWPHVRIIPTLLTLGVAWVVSKIVGAMNTDLDTKPHNDKKVQKMEKEMESLGHSGDENADAVIQKGQEMLRQIRAENEAIPDPTLSHQMYELEYQCLQIFKTVQESPNKAPQIRKFMNYYLPTTLKMLANYRTMQNRGVSQADLNEARNTLIHGMNMILQVGQKQIDNLFKGDMLDISTDIDVLEQMLKRDGFTDGGLGDVPVSQTQASPTTDIKPQARTAAAAQMGTSSHPTIEVPEEDQPQNYKSNHAYTYQGKN